MSFETVQVLETSHKGGVLQLQFSADGKKIVSVGMDSAFSIQVFQWEQARTLAFRNSGYLPIFGIKFDPYNSNRFVTCGYEHMAVWKLNGTHLSCTNFQHFYSSKLVRHEQRQAHAQEEQKEEARVLAKSVLMAIDFLSYRLGHSIQSDALFGSSQGEITTYCSGRHFVLNENAHAGPINCLKVTDTLTTDNVNIITGGEEGLIKIWDSAVQLLQVVDIRQAVIIKNYKNPRSYAIQSLDMYCCDKNHPRKILVGVRCGDVWEAVVEDIPGRYEEQMVEK